MYFQVRKFFYIAQKKDENVHRKREIERERERDKQRETKSMTWRVTWHDMKVVT